MAYADFKSYFQDKYSDMLAEAIQSFVNKHHDGIGFHGINVLSIADQKVENIEVKSLVCHEDGIGDLLRMEVRTESGYQSNRSWSKNQMVYCARNCRAPSWSS